MRHHPASRPVVALDIDGVLNPLTRDEETPGFGTHHVHVPAHHVPDSLFVRGHGHQPLDVTVRLHPGHGAWISSLLDVADVVWATTWEQAANTHIAPLLGIDPLPVGVSVAAHPPRFGDVRGGDAGAWKASALADAFPGRPLVWVDDATGPYASMAAVRDRTRHLTISRSQDFLNAARRYRWEEHDDFAPTAHYEDTWAAGQYLVRSTWSTIASGSPFRFRDGTLDPAPTMVVATAPEIGLTVDQMSRISRFVHEHAAA